jgi:hypothetical protein
LDPLTVQSIKEYRLLFSIPNSGETDPPGTFHHKIGPCLSAPAVQGKRPNMKKSRIQIKPAAKKFQNESADVFRAANHVGEIRHSLACKKNVLGGLGGNGPFRRG